MQPRPQCGDRSARARTLIASLTLAFAIAAMSLLTTDLASALPLVPGDRAASDIILVRDKCIVGTRFSNEQNKCVPVRKRSQQSSKRKSQSRNRPRRVPGVDRHGCGKGWHYSRRDRQCVKGSGFEFNDVRDDDRDDERDDERDFDRERDQDRDFRDRTQRVPGVDRYGCGRGWRYSFRQEECVKDRGF